MKAKIPSKDFREVTSAILAAGRRLGLILSLSLIACLNVYAQAQAEATTEAREAAPQAKINRATAPLNPSPVNMIIAMKTGETHLSTATIADEGRLARWLDIQTASVSSRYQYIENGSGRVTANHNQYQGAFKGRVKFDSQGNFSLNAGVFSGRSFFGGWNNSGWGTGEAVTNLFLKQLYFSARPVSGIEIQYGGLDLAHGETTEITGYDYDGYVTGERLKLTRPQELFFDEISITSGYLGDFNRPNLNKRYHRLKQANFYHVLVGKKIGARIATSVDYSSEAGVDVFREAIRIRLPESRVLDTLQFENYQRASGGAGYGFGLYAEKRLRKRMTLGGGYAQIDRTGLNSDRFPQGKRLHLSGHVALNSAISFVATFTQAVGNLPASLPRTRIDIGLNYNLLQALKKLGL